MKTAQDPRHQKRITLMQKLFSVSFGATPEDDELSQIQSNLTHIDKAIEISAPEWPVAKIAKVDLAILRLAIYELAIAKKEPPKVIIDEAIELAKQYGNEHSAAFINGALGNMYKRVYEQGETLI